MVRHMYRSVALREIPLRTRLPLLAFPVRVGIAVGTVLGLRGLAWTQVLFRRAPSSTAHTLLPPTLFSSSPPSPNPISSCRSMAIGRASPAPDRSFQHDVPNMTCRLHLKTLTCVMQGDDWMPRMQQSTSPQLLDWKNPGSGPRM